MKSVRFQSFPGLYFHKFGLNTEIYSVNLRIPSECGKIRTRKTPNTDTYDAVRESRENSTAVTKFKMSLKKLHNGNIKLLRKHNHSGQ